MSNLNDIRTQAATLESARKRGHHYTQADLDLLKELRDKHVPARIMAVTLNRTLYGVRGALKVTDERRERKVATRRPELPYDRGFTTLEEMGF
jgi:hypothetical protein